MLQPKTGNKTGNMNGCIKTEPLSAPCHRLDWAPAHECRALCCAVRPSSRTVMYPRWSSPEPRCHQSPRGLSSASWAPRCAAWNGRSVRRYRCSCPRSCPWRVRPVRRSSLPASRPTASADFDNVCHWFVDTLLSGEIKTNGRLGREVRPKLRIEVIGEVRQKLGRS